MAQVKAKTIYQVGYFACGVWLVSAEGDSEHAARHMLNNKLCIIQKLHADYSDCDYRVDTKEVFVYE